MSAHVRAQRLRSRNRKSYNSKFIWTKFLQSHPEYDRKVPLAVIFSGFLYLVAKYFFRLEVRGVENIPYGKRFVWTHNHSGWLALDAPLIGFIIARNNHNNRFSWTPDRMGRLAILRKFLPEIGDWGISFWNKKAIQLPIVGQMIRTFHGVSVEELRQPDKFKEYPIYVTPAEGEEGACKSSFSELYHLKRFHTGIARLAFENDVNYILPVMIMGPEESFLNLGPLRRLREKVGTILPMPLPVPPLPVKWVVSYLRPINIRRYWKEYLRYRRSGKTHLFYRKIVDKVKKRIADAMDREQYVRKPYEPWILRGHLASNAYALLRELTTEKRSSSRIPARKNVLIHA